ncbi:MAG TPA: hypothetical protein VFX58_15465 [Chitinophagaceae bacterium]|nr:hypothetical protein [Chitinophagaceae bacterium]
MKMNFTRSFLTLTVLVTVFSSCQKEVDLQNSNNGNNGGNTAGIVGNYDFVGLSASTVSTVVTGSGIDEEKAVTRSSYSSTNNVGTVAITATQFNTTGIGYSISGIAYTDFYIGNVLFTSLDFPFDFVLPPTNGSSNYRMITNDSIYFDNGFISYDPTGSGNPTATLPTGARLSWSADTLLMKTSATMTSTQDIGGGVMARITNQATQIVKMKKK